jgi:antitoxin (DNA-binding transcriptional repressor) of toxin-antitoxin stability system
MTRSVVGVHEAKTQLSRLLQRVAAGEEIDIARRGQIVARLVAPAVNKTRRLGVDRGRFVVPPDFDEPLPEDLLKAFGA